MGGRGRPVKGFSSAFGNYLGNFDGGSVGFGQDDNEFTKSSNPKPIGKYKSVFGGGGTETGGLTAGETQITRPDKPATTKAEKKTSKKTNDSANYTTFSDKAEAHAYFLANEDNYKISADSVAMNGFSSYKGGSSSFNSNGLRKTNGDVSSLPSYIQGHVKAMDAHMSKPGNALKKNTTLYRGIQVSDKNLWAALNTPGATFVDHGYPSFTGSKSKAREGAEGMIYGGSGEKIYLKVLAPKGMKGT